MDLNRSLTVSSRMEGNVEHRQKGTSIVHHQNKNVHVVIYSPHEIGQRIGDSLKGDWASKIEGDMEGPLSEKGKGQHCYISSQP